MKRKRKLTDVLALLLITAITVGISAYAVVSQADEIATSVNAGPRIVLRVLNENAIVSYGDRIVLKADISGIQREYDLQWQQNDGKGWSSIPGAYGDEYSFKLTRANEKNAYRVILNIRGGGQIIFSTAEPTGTQAK